MILIQIVDYILLYVLLISLMYYFMVFREEQ